MISVVIPLYNKAPHVAAALQSVLDQTWTDFEVLVVDDGSTDGSGHVVAQFRDPRVRVFHQENRGVSAARNRGIRESCGELVAFLDADDTWGATFLEQVLELRDRFPQAGMYVVAYRVQRPGGLSQEIVLPEDSSGARRLLLTDYFSKAIECPLAHTSSIAVPRNILEELGGFAEGEWRGEDIDMWGRIAIGYPVAVDRVVCNTYRMDAAGRTPAESDANKVPPFVRSARAALDQGAVPPAKIEALKEYLCLLWFDQYKKAIRLGNRPVAERILRDELHDSPKFGRTAAMLLTLHSFFPIRGVHLLLRLLRSRYAACVLRCFPAFRGMTPSRSI